MTKYITIADQHVATIDTNLQYEAALLDVRSAFSQEGNTVAAVPFILK
jgi:hypothetical protein